MLLTVSLTAPMRCIISKLSKCGLKFHVRQAQALKQHVWHSTFGTVQCMTQIPLKRISTKMERKYMYRANIMLPIIFSTARMHRTTLKQSR